MRRCLVLAGCFLVCLFGMHEQRMLIPLAAQGPPAPAVRIGLVESLFRDTSEALMQVAMRPFRALMYSQTGIPGQLVGGGDAEHLSQLLEQGRVHLGIFHGFEFAWARQKHPELKPLLIAVNGQCYLRACLLVRASGTVNGVEDLQGQKVALPLHSREHCRLFMERRCVPHGSHPSGYYKRLTLPRNAENAIEDVIDGTVKAAVIDEMDLDAFRRSYPDRASRVRVLHQSEPFPCAVIAYAPGTLSDSMLQRFREGMLAARSTERGRQMLDMCRITNFEEVPADYDHMLAVIARAYPPPTR